MAEGGLPGPAPHREDPQLQPAPQPLQLQPGQQVQMFHVWRSFHYDENVETPEAYVTRIRQVARLLGYG